MPSGMQLFYARLSSFFEALFHVTAHVFSVSLQEQLDTPMDQKRENSLGQLFSCPKFRFCPDRIDSA